MKEQTRIRPPAAALRLLMALVLAIGLMPLPAYAEVTAGSMRAQDTPTQNAISVMSVDTTSQPGSTLVTFRVDLAQETSEVLVRPEVGGVGPSSCVSHTFPGWTVDAMAASAMADFYEDSGATIPAGSYQAVLLFEGTGELSYRTTDTDPGASYVSEYGFVPFDEVKGYSGGGEDPQAYTVSLSSGEASPGGSVTVTLSGANAPQGGVSELMIYFDYDPDALTLCEAAPVASDFDTVELMNDSRQGHQKILDIYNDSGGKFGGGGELVSLTFDVSPSAAAGAYQVTMSSANSSNDGYGFEGGTVTVTGGGEPQPVVDPVKPGNASTQGNVHYAWSYGGNITYDESGGFTITPFTAEGVTYKIDTIVVDGDAIELTDAQKAQPYVVASAHANSSVFATFAYVVNFNSPEHGALSVARADGTVLKSGDIVRGGEVLTITATPADGYETDGEMTLVGLEVVDANAGTYRVMAENGDATPAVSVAFKEAQPPAGTHTVKIVLGQHMSVADGAVLVQHVAEGEAMADVTVTFESGYWAGCSVIPHWLEGGGVEPQYNFDGSITIAGTPAADVTVTFADAHEGSLGPWKASVFAGTMTGGTVEIAPPEGKDLEALSPGDVVTVTAVPDEGYELVSVWARSNYGYTTIAESGGAYSIAMPNSDARFGATFAPVGHSVAVTVGPHMTSTGQLEQKGLEGPMQEVAVTPEEGFRVAPPQVSPGDAGIEASYDEATATWTVTGTPAADVSVSFPYAAVVPAVAGSEGGSLAWEYADAGLESVVATATPEEGKAVRRIEIRLDGGAWQTLPMAVGDDGSATATAGIKGASASAELRAAFADPSELELRVSTAQELADFAARVNSGEDFMGMTVFLEEDIDLSAFADWTPIGTSSAPFKGTFDGQGHSVTGFSVTSAAGGLAGLFGFVRDGAVRDLSVSGSVAAGNAFNAGGVVAFLYDGEVSGCTSSVGVATASTPRSRYAGGIVGHVAGNTASRVSGCANLGAVSGGTAGGIVGVCAGSDALSVSVEGCANYGHVSASCCAAGIATNAGDGPVVVSSCANKGPVTASSADSEAACAGILVGYSSMTNGGPLAVADCYNTAAVTGSTGARDRDCEPCVAGILAFCERSSSVPSLSAARCYNTGTLYKEGEHTSTSSRYGEIVPKTTVAGTYAGGFYEEPLPEGTIVLDEGNMASAEMVALSADPAAAAAAMGDAYKADTNGTNPGFTPLLAWEEEVEPDFSYHDVTFAATDALTGEPLEGFTVTIEGVEGSGPAFSLQNGGYAYTVSKDGYAPGSGAVTVSRADVEVAVALSPFAHVTVTLDPADAALAMACGGEAVEPEADGSYLLVAGREYSYTASAGGCYGRTGAFTASDGMVLAISLDRISDFGGLLHGGELITEGGRYRLADDATGTITLGEGIEVEIAGSSYDSATGSFSGPTYRDLTVVVGDGAALSIRDIWIELDESAPSAVEIQGQGTLLVEGTNLVDRPGGYGQYSVIHVGPGSSVTLGGSGVLYGYKHAQGAYIGANGNEENGEITFSGGTWFLKGSKTGPIVGSDGDKGGDIRIEGGEIYLKTVSQGSCIGASRMGSAPDVYITGGMVQLFTDFSGSAIGYGGKNAGSGMLTVAGGSVMVMAGMNAYASGDASNTWGIDPAIHIGSVITDEPITATHTTAQLEFPTAAYADESSIDVYVDGSLFYSGKPYYGWITNEVKNPSSATPQTLSNWLSNDTAYVPASYEGCYPVTDGNMNAGIRALYFQLPAGVDHVISVGSDAYDATWDEADGTWSLAFDQAAADQAVADGVAALIDGLPADDVVTAGGAEALEAVAGAVDAYLALTYSQKGLVGAEQLARLRSAARAAADAAGQAAADKQAAERRAEELEAGMQAAQQAAQETGARADDLQGELATAVAQAAAAQAKVAALSAEVAAAQAAQGLKANPMTVKAKTVKAKAGKGKTVKKAKAFTVKGAKGKVTFYKVSGNAKVAVTKAGKVKVKAGLKAKKKAYKVKVLVVAAGDKDYAPAVRTVTLKVKVK